MQNATKQIPFFLFLRKKRLFLVQNMCFFLKSYLFVLFLTKFCYKIKVKMSSVQNHKADKNIKCQKQAPVAFGGKRLKWLK